MPEAMMPEAMWWTLIYILAVTNGLTMWIGTRLLRQALEERRRGEEIPEAGQTAR